MLEDKVTKRGHIRNKWFNNGEMPNTLYKVQLPKKIKIGRRYKTNLQIFFYKPLVFQK